MTSLTPRHSYPYPDPADNFAENDLQLKALALALDDLGHTGAGTVSGTSLAASGGILNTVIPFGTTFAVAPRTVLVTIGNFVSGSSLIILKGTNTITTTGFTLSLVNCAAGAATWTALPFRWVVIP